jgi:hypothetical protein
MKSLRSSRVKIRSAAAKSRTSSCSSSRTSKGRVAKDPLDGLLGQLERGRARVPVARKGKPQAMLISMREFARLRAIDESPHAEIIGRLLFAR